VSSPDHLSWLVLNVQAKGSLSADQVHVMKLNESKPTEEVSNRYLVKVSAPNR
jgi:hypothetical protein